MLEFGSNVAIKYNVARAFVGAMFSRFAGPQSILPRHVQASRLQASTPDQVRFIKSK